MPFRPMSMKEYRTAIDRLGLSQLAAGDFLGISARQSRAYALGEFKVPKSIAVLLRLMIKDNLTPDDIDALSPLKVRPV
jgi:hypothetical protein